MPEQEAAENLATGIYGTILATALITAFSEDPGSDPLQVAVAVVVTARTARDNCRSGSERLLRHRRRRAQGARPLNPFNASTTSNTSPDSSRFA
jgi:hypothetical protein